MDIEELAKKVEENSKRLDEHIEEIKKNGNNINSNSNNITKNSYALELISQINQDSQKWYKIAKNLIIALLVVILLWSITIVYLVHILNDTGTIEETITQDNQSGYNNYIGNDGEIVNGKADN